MFLLRAARTSDADVGATAAGEVRAEGLPKGSHTAVIAAPPQGPFLERYVFQHEIGDGGFGHVCRATDRVTGEPVAVKRVPLADPRAVPLHRREVAALRRARVPGVVDILAADESDGWGIVVMPLVAGARFPGRGVAQGDVAAVASRGVALLQILAGVHAAGVFHRDVKASNVLVGDDGRVTLVDFGIADDAYRQNAQLAGTRGHIAPELFASRRADARTDLFAAGVVLLEAILGAKAGLGEQESAAAARPAWEALRVRAAGAIAEPLLSVLLGLVAPDPLDRPQSAQAAAEALETALGRSRRIDLPYLGSREPIRRVVEAARAGRAIDLVGPQGSGRSRVLDEAEAALRAAGFLVHRATPARPAESGAVRDPLEREEADRAICRALTRRVTEGLVVLSDDHDALDAPTKALVDDLRGVGAVVRAVASSDGDRVELAALAQADVEDLVDAPERIFQARSEAARILMRRTGGSPAALAREVRAWCATGLASWNGRLAVDAQRLDRLRALPAAALAGSAPRDLSPAALSLWGALSVAGEPLSVAALADVVDLPSRVVAAELPALLVAGLVRETGDAVEAARTAPATVASPELRRVWASRAADAVPETSPSRFHLLVAAERHTAACRAAPSIVRAGHERGDAADAAALLDTALAFARRHAPEEDALYLELLAAAADAALSRGTKAAVDLALHHAALARPPLESVRAWMTILEAGAAALSGDALRALRLLDDGGAPPTEPHRRAALRVGALAARTSGDAALHAEAARRVAVWAESASDRDDALALASAAEGWVRYEAGAYADACRLHAEAARRTRRRRARTTSLCSAAMAALEADDLAGTVATAGDALGAATRTRDDVNAARAELLLRQAAYRDGSAATPDDELLAAADALDRGATRGMIRLNEAAVAWRARALERAGTLALDAAHDLRGARLLAAAALASALAAACGARADAELVSAISCRTPPLAPVGLAAQAAALLADSPLAVALPADVLSRALDWARGMRSAETRREVLSPREAAERLGRIARTA